MTASQFTPVGLGFTAASLLSHVTLAMPLFDPFIIFRSVSAGSKPGERHLGR